MSLLTITMKLVYNFYSSFKGSKYKMAAKFGQKNRFCYQINWCAILISSLNLTKQGGFDSKTLYIKLRCQQLNFWQTWSPRGHFLNIGYKIWRKANIRIFQTELLIVMDLQDIPLNIYFTWCILMKYLGNSLLFNKSVKIQDGCQSNSMIPAVEFF